MVLVLPLLYEVREMIYDELEPHITIEPQYPVNMRMAFEPDWKPGYETHPMYGINKAMDADILSRYYNQADTAQTRFLPGKTTFRIWDKHSRLMKMHMDAFFSKSRNRFGVRHVEYIFDHYNGEHDDFFEMFERFPNLRTVKIKLRYKAGIVDGCAAEILKKHLKTDLEFWFRCGSTRSLRSRHTGARLDEVRWEAEESRSLEGEEAKWILK